MEKISLIEKTVVRHTLLSPRSDHSEEEVLNFFQTHIAREVLYTSSASLYREYLRWEEGKLGAKRRAKLVISLYKYILRMKHRATPFGLLSAIGLIENPDLQAFQLTETKRKTSLDSSLLAQIMDQIRELNYLKPYLIFQLNTSLYSFRDHYRFVEHRKNENGEEHILRSLKRNPIINDYAEWIGKGKTYQELHSHLESYADDEKLRTSYLDELIRLQFLKAELSLSLSEGDNLSRLIKILKRIDEKFNIEIPHFRKLLDDFIQLKIRLIRLDKHEYNRISAYKAIIHHLRSFQLDLQINEERVFQINLYSELGKCRSTANEPKTDALKELIDLIPTLVHISPRQSLKRFDEFKSSFRERYGERSIPLSVAMDPDIGIGYAKQNATKAPVQDLLAGLDFDSKKETSLLDKNLLDACLNLKPDQNIPPKEIDLESLLSEKELKSNALSSLPPTFSLKLKKVISDNGKGMYLINHIGGSNGLQYLGRFCSQMKALDQMARKVAGHEINCWKGARLAEFYHQSQGRAVNILERPNYYPSAIHFMDPANQNSAIPIKDLQLCLKGEELILHDKEGSRIIPRYSNAHDHSIFTLPLYHFLGDLQSQGFVDQLDIRLELTSRSIAVPRVVYKNFILKEAQWILQEFHLKEMVSSRKSAIGLRRKLGIPEKFLVGEGDRCLPIDLDTELGFELFKELAKGKKALRLTEYLATDPNFLSNSKGEALEHELVLVARNHLSKSRPTHIPASCSAKELDQFESQWIYLKLYCNPSNSDLLLIKHKGFIEALRRKEKISNWFFIRFQDPKYHLRIRLKIKDSENAGLVFQEWGQLLAELKSDGLIWRYQFENYQRETLRYGLCGLALAEKLFGYDSDSYLKFISSFQSIEKEYHRWQFGILSINDWMQVFELNRDDVFTALKDFRDSLASEYNFGKDCKKSLAKQFRKKRKQIANLLNSSDTSELNQVLIKGIISERNLKSQKAIRNHFNTLNGSDKAKLFARILDSIIHMSINRLFITAPRVQEFVLYDLLLAHFRSEQAREKFRTKLSL